MVETFCPSARAGECRSPAASGEDGLRGLEAALTGYASAPHGALCRPR